MNTPNDTKLNKRQREILSKLAWGWSYPRICEHFGINSAHLHTLCHQIRKKTGIQNTQDAVECRNWQRGNREDAALNLGHRYQPKPTLMQLSVMRLRAQGLDYDTIAAQLGLIMQTAQNHCSQGCRRAKIGGAKHNRIYALQRWLVEHDGAGTPAEKDPLENY